jgi:phage-related protein (TIGR01555 family)
LSGTIGKIATLARATLDGWVNAFTGLGTALHDALGGTYAGAAQNKSEEHYENLMRVNALARRIARLPAREMLRQGYEIEVADDPDYDERPVMDEVERLGLDAELVWSMTLARGTGGSVLVPILDDGSLDLKEPLNLERIREVTEIRVVSKKCATRIATGSPIFRIQYPGTSLPAVEMHESRLIIFDGERVTDDAKAANMGWGDSIFLALEEPLARLGTSWQALGNMLVDGSLGVLKLKHFHDMVAGNAGGDEAVRTRFRLMAHGRSVARAVALDADMEDFTWQNRNFAGIPDSIYAIMSELSSETGIPITKLFGRSAAGMNATGEGDAKDWYNEVAADRREKLEPQHKRVLRMIMMQKKPGLGKEPKRWSPAYNPLWQMSEKEQAEVRKLNSDASALDIANQVITPEEDAISRYGGKKYSSRIVIDTSLREPLTESEGMPTGGGDDIQKTVLNGAQIAGIADIVRSVAAGEMPRESGVALIHASMGGAESDDGDAFTEEDAERIMGSAGAGFKPTPKEPPPGQEPAEDDSTDPDAPAPGGKKPPRGQDE